MMVRNILSLAFAPHRVSGGDTFLYLVVQSEDRYLARNRNILYSILDNIPIKFS